MRIVACHAMGAARGDVLRGIRTVATNEFD